MMDTIAIERGSLVEESGREGVVRGVGAAWSGASERSRTGEHKKTQEGKGGGGRPWGTRESGDNKKKEIRERE